MNRTDHARVAIRAAEPSEAALLSKLALRSKAYWGYDEEFIQNCIAELSYSKSDIEHQGNICSVAVLDERVVGFYLLTSVNTDAAILEALFVEPALVGHSIGSRLFEDVINQLKGLDVMTFRLQSDPNAEQFYLSKGMVNIGKTESGSVPGRYLPNLEFSLSLQHNS